MDTGEKLVKTLFELARNQQDENGEKRSACLVSLGSWLLGSLPFITCLLVSTRHTQTACGDKETGRSGDTETACVGDKETRR